MNLILGFIGENHSTLQETKEFIKQVLPQTLSISAVRGEGGTAFTQIAIENGWASGDGDWKELMTGGYQLSNYPYYPNMEEEHKKIMRVLHHNPKWWLYNADVLTRNPAVLLPTLRIYARQFRKKNIRSEFEI